MLLPTPDGNGRVPIIEVLTGTPLMQDHIRKGEVHMMKELMKKSTEVGMQTFDQALFKAYRDGKVTYEDAIKHADSPNDLRLMIKLQGDGDAELQTSLADTLTIQDDEDKNRGGFGMGMMHKPK